MAVIAGAGRVRQDGLHAGRVKFARFSYDFDTDGGAVSDITLRGETVPSGAIVTDVLLDVDTVPTSGGSATIALKIEGSDDLDAAAAISGAPYSSTGAKRVDLTATSTPVTLTDDRSVVATVATAALTAGAFTVTVTYLEL